MDPKQVEAWLSTARFEPFLTAAGDNHIRAVELYDWHAETAAASFGMLHHFEIIVRNAIDGVLGEGQPEDPIKDTWLMDFDTLQPDGVKQVIVAVERLDRGKGITRSRVIAGVSFGFWAGLSATATRSYGATASATPSLTDRSSARSDAADAAPPEVPQPRRSPRLPPQPRHPTASRRHAHDHRLDRPQRTEMATQTLARSYAACDQTLSASKAVQVPQKPRRCRGRDHV